MDNQTEPTGRMSWDTVGEADTRKRQRVWIDKETKGLIAEVRRGYADFWRRRGRTPPPVSSAELIFGNFFSNND